ncbi:retron system putative HNH endonuclease [Burkholderia stabilis]|uniref:retron system putative HNH endonuclease n=1 Tax=Burkholderia stabilis TaxID=95485 RepID=UPI00158FF882|nr:retron system putative HNH endonuclease [Burkholderia stabilis]
MKYIQKLGGAGYHLAQAHLNPPATSHIATTRWSAFAHKEYVLNQLLTEQHHLCCYTELRSDLEGLGYHIEHIENKSQNPQRTFDYQNLGASAIDSRIGLSIVKVDGITAFGGHATGKQTACDMTHFVSPHQGNCTGFFSYLSDGRIVPSLSLDDADKSKAQYTIDILNLNSPYLVGKRKRWWQELDDLFQEHLDKNWNISDLISLDVVPSNGRLSNFFSLTRQFFGNAAEEVIAAEAPYLR